MDLKSIPIELSKFAVNLFSVYLRIKLDFPTPESPIKRILNNSSLLTIINKVYYSDSSSPIISIFNYINNFIIKSDR